MLREDERDFRQFLFEAEDGYIGDYRMKRLTFGVTSSPFIATQVLQQAAEDYKEAYSEPARLINENFYVNGVLNGTSTIGEATHIRTGP